jgi:hypothetical protein
LAENRRGRRTAGVDDRDGGRVARRASFFRCAPRARRRLRAAAAHCPRRLPRWEEQTAASPNLVHGKSTSRSRPRCASAASPLPRALPASAAAAAAASASRGCAGKSKQRQTPTCDTAAAMRKAPHRPRAGSSRPHCRNNTQGRSRRQPTHLDAHCSGTTTAE